MSDRYKPEQLEDILIIDDQAANLRILSEILTQNGYKVRKAINPLSALKAIQSTPPDLILLDIKMPEMDGYQLCEQIKSDPELSEIPVIFISALDEVFNKVRAFEVGGVDYITKPFQDGEVIARIKNQLLIQSQKNSLEQKLRNGKKPRKFYINLAL